MATKVKGEAIKEGSISMSALSTEVKNKIENSGGADWNAQKGEAGYIENRTHYTTGISIGTTDYTFLADIPKRFDSDSGIYYLSEEIHIQYSEDDYVGIIKIPVNTPLGYDMRNTRFSIIGDDQGEEFTFSSYSDMGDIYFKVENPNSGTDFRVLSYTPLKGNFIPNTVLKTTPQTLSDTDKNQALANLGLSDVVTVINDMPIVKGDVENSAVLKGGNNQVISEGGVALGKDNLVGLKGWYYGAINKVSSKLINVYLTNEQKVPAWNQSYTLNPSDANLLELLGKDTIISLINDSKYDNIFKIVQGRAGMVQLTTVDGTNIPFDAIKRESDLSPEDYSIYCLDKPEIGSADLGKYSFANGSDNKSINVYTEVSGKGNVAKGKFAKVWGKDNIGGYNTTTFGTNNVNLADNSFVNGTNNINEGNNSVIHGNKNKNYGKRAFVVGNENITNNENEAAFGKYNNSENDTQFSIGIGTSEDDRKNAFEVKQNGDIYIKDVEGRIQDKLNDNSPILKSTGVGSAIQAKEVDTFVDENPDAPTSGQDIPTEASGNYSVVLNGKSNASAKRALAHGNRTIAQGENSHTEGHCTQTVNIDEVTNGYAAHAEGYGSIAGGTYSHAEGNKTKTAAPNSHAEGYLSITTPEAESSHAEGYETSAEAPASHTEGNNTKTHKAYSHAEGRQTETFGEASHTEGNDTLTEGDYAHAEGWMTRAKGAYSHSEGQYTFTYADAAHSEGNNTHAHAPFSHAEGLGTKTNPDIIGQHVEGYYNADSDGVKVIGCGTADDARMNAVEVKQDGRVFVKGLGNFDGINSNEAADLAHVVDSKANSGDVYNKTELDNHLKSDFVQKVEVATINGQSLIKGGNINIEDESVFVAEYGVTDYDEVMSAYNSGKICICKYNTNIYYGYSLEYGGTSFTFACIQHYASNGNNLIDIGYIKVYKSLSKTHWEPVVIQSVEKAANKTNTINVESTDIQYPSAKSVYNALTAKADKTELTQLSEKVDTLPSATPDWNAQEGKAGYIENRTHYFDIIGGKTLKDISVASDIYADSKLKSHNREFITDDDNYFMKLVYEQSADTYIENLYIGPELIKAIQGKRIYYNHAIYQFDYSYSYDSTTDTDIETYTSTIWIDVDFLVDTLEDDEQLEYAKEKAKESILVYDIEQASPSGKYFIKKTLEDKYLPDTLIKTTPQTLSDDDKNQVLTNLGIYDKSETYSKTEIDNRLSKDYYSISQTNNQISTEVNKLATEVSNEINQLVLEIEANEETVAAAITDLEERISPVKCVGNNESTKYLMGVTAYPPENGTGITESVVDSGVTITNSAVSALNGFYQTSDECFKDFHGEIELDFERLKEIPKIFYTWKGDESQQMQIGTSAQKVREIYPEIVSEDENGKLSVDYSKLSIIALKAIDILNKERQEMKKDIEAIKSKLGL